MGVKCGIYCIENVINHKKYIGLSKNIQRRWCEHQSELRRGEHDNIYLQHAWNKYGENAFEFYILEECDEIQLSTRETYYISLFQSMSHENGYNLTTGGENAITHSKRIIDYRTGQIYPSIASLCHELHKSHPTIVNWCRQRKYYMFYDEWTQLNCDEQFHVQNKDWAKIDHDRLSKAHQKDNLSPETIEKYKQAARGKNNLGSFSVYCPELDEYFWGAQEAHKKYGFNAGSISQCISGKLAHAGKHPITGEGLTWQKVMEE